MTQTTINLRSRFFFFYVKKEALRFFMKFT